MHICLINLPRYEIHRPPLSLAILSAICEEEGLEYSCVDFSLLIWQKLPEHFHDIDNFCITQIINDIVKQKLCNLIDITVSDILARYPNATFALSLLSVWSCPIAELFCASIKKLCSNQILLGGQGLQDPLWTHELKTKGLIDHFIVGEGEVSFRNFIRGDINGPGINNYQFQQLDDLDSVCVIPNYTKLPLDAYPYLNQNPDLFITASRGCVRNCAYCDIGHQWPKYRYRSAEHVAKEMITQFERHGISEFFFTDSLINGGMKMLNELCDKLIQYKSAHGSVNFKLRGQYIFRPVDTVSEDHIKKMAMAGVDYLIVGLETGSDRVRYAMNKKHTTADAEWFLEMFSKYGIKCRLLMLTGWVTETLEDHYDTLKLFAKWQKFVANETITGIELGSTLSILEHSPIGKQHHEFEMSFINDKPYLWNSATNPDLDIHERIRRRIETHKEAIKFNWPITRSLYRLNTIKSHFLEAVDHMKTHARPKKLMLKIKN